MGSSESSCQQCVHLGEPGSSVITFSDDLLNRLTDGKLEKMAEEKKEAEARITEGCSSTKYPSIKLSKCENILQEPEEEDKLIFDSLDCMDEKHSDKYNLTYEYVDRMTSELLDKVNILQYKTDCTGEEEVIKCYEKHVDNILDCDLMIRKYLDCIDVTRWKELKKYMKCDIDKIFKEGRKNDCKNCCN